ncbi:MAG TPA: hypothetical protein VK348_07475, partial [Planctomycetota bacterium]|nr:hypothetical protein [Planctomycetota bacterium]
TGADFAGAVTAIAARLRCTPVPVVLPLYDDAGRFCGLGDVLGGALHWFPGAQSAAAVVRSTGELHAARERALEACAEIDEVVMADFVAGRPVTAAALQAALRRGCCARRLLPVLCGSALRNQGVDLLLDAVVALLPKPADRVRPDDPAPDPAAPFCGMVFKVQHLAGEVLAYLRVFRGTLRSGDVVQNARAAVRLQVPALCFLHVLDRVPTARASAGEIAVILGELGLATGDTLHDPAHACLVTPVRFPLPVVTATFEPRVSADAAALFRGLAALAIDDPTLVVEHDTDSALPSVSGLGELHLEITADRLREATGLQFELVRHRVAMFETVSAPASASAEVHAEIGGREHTALVEVEVLPAPGQDAVVEDATAPNSPPALVAAALAELRGRTRIGLRSANPVRDLRIRLRALQLLPQPAPGGGESLVQEAARVAAMRAVGSGRPRLLEPMVAIEVRCPQESLSAVLADLNARGASIRQVAAGDLGALIHGRSALARMLGYATRLRSITRGHGMALLVPDGHQLVAREV